MMKLEDNILRPKIWLYLLISSVANLLWVTLFVWGAKMTIMSHAEIFASLSGNFIILYRLLLRQPISKIEIVASIIAFAGVGIISLDEHAKKVDSKSEHIILGNLICLSSSIFGAINLQYSQELMTCISVIHILFFQCLLVALIQMPLGFLLLKNFSLTFDPLYGYFGCLHPSNIVTCIFFNSLVSQILY